MKSGSLKDNVKFVTCQIASRPFPGFWPTLHRLNSAQIYGMKLLRTGPFRLILVVNLLPLLTGQDYV